MVGQPARRYHALDALRGICALLVALFHLKSAGLISQLPLVRNAWLFVDFFFVLSGFVIAASYGEKLRQGFSVGRFMLLRLGRVYPLHLFMLAVYAAFETLKLALGTPAWQSPNGLIELVQSLTLTQIFGLTGDLAWNGPSWSIAAEVWAYLAMAIVLALAGKRAAIAIAVIGLVSGAVLLAMGHPFLNHTFSFALVRCLYGFALGMLTFSLCHARAAWAKGRAATLIEWATLAAVAGYVALVPAEGWQGLLAPPVFVIGVAVFSFEQGGVSRFLTRPFPLMLGAVSYSIYMIHAFVEARAVDVALALANITGLPLAEWGRDALGHNAQVLGTAAYPWVGDILTLAVLALIIALAWLSYMWIETPAREYARWRVLGGSSNRQPSASTVD